MAGQLGFWQELQRRHVWRVMVAYVVVGWLVIQAGATIIPALHLPGSLETAIIVVGVLGFPVVVVLAWAFEITPEGVRRTAPADSPEARAQHDSRSIARKLNAIIIVVLVLAVAMLGWRLYAVRHAKPAVTVAPKPAAAAPAVPAKSIAVLPFENLSTDKGNAYFADGMQDLILTKLADIGDLKVISRTSTLQFGSHPQNLKTVGEQLGVATILEGSVQKAGNDVLINVQLINAQTDAHVWAQTYRRTLTDVFGVEGEVAGQIASSLNARLSPAQSAELAAVPTRNRAAYDAFLRAEYLTNQGERNYQSTGLADLKAALPLYRQAVAADPTFALAWARLSYAESQLAWFGGGGESIPELNARARADAAQAVKLAPDLAAAQIARGYVAYYGKMDYPAALAAFAAALKLKPNDADAWLAQGFVQRRQGRFDTAIASLKQALSLDPRNSALAYDLGDVYMTLSRFPEAEQAFQRALALDPQNLNAQSSYPSAILYASGDLSKALAAAQGDSVAQKLRRVSLLAYQRQYARALALLDTIPDTLATFDAMVGASKAQAQADIYALLGESAKARALYAADLPRARAAIDTNQMKAYQGAEWGRVADDELGLGHTAQGLATIAKVQALLDQDKVATWDLDPAGTELNASLYAKARRPDLAVPLLTRALAMPGIGWSYAPVLLWLDPSWDPIRASPAFQALLKKYAKDKPAVIPAASAAGATTAKAPAPS